MEESLPFLQSSTRYKNGTKVYLHLRFGLLSVIPSKFSTDPTTRWDVVVCCAKVRKNEEKRTIQIKNPGEKIRTFRFRSQTHFLEWSKALEKSSTWSIHDYYSIESEVDKCQTYLVRLAKHSESSEQLTIKTIPYGSAYPQPYQITEVLAMTSLPHPCIMQAQDVFYDEHALHIVMPRMLDKSLEEYMRDNRPVTEPTVRKIAFQLLSAAAFMEDRGFVHRDIEAKSVLLKDDETSPRIMITEFGLSGHRMADCSFYPTPRFIADHYRMLWLRENQASDSTSDIWAIGALIYFALCGKPPIKENSGELRRLNVTGSLWGSVSDEAKSFVLSILEEDRNCRATALEALEHPWMDLK